MRGHSRRRTRTFVFSHPARPACKPAGGGHCGHTESLTQKQRFSQTMLLLDACSPLKILERGYSVALKEGKPVHDIKELEINDPVKVVLEKGSFDALVLSKEEKTWLKNN